jgi:hypothetical protein
MLEIGAMVELAQVDVPPRLSETLVGSVARVSRAAGARAG